MHHIRLLSRKATKTAKGSPNRGFQAKADSDMAFPMGSGT